MPHMTFDWLTSGLMRPLLAAHGLGLSDLAGSLHQAVAGTYGTVENGPTGFTLGLATFTTAYARPGDHLVELAAPGYDPFSSPMTRRPFPKLPEIWGGVTIDATGEHRLHLSGIALHADLIALPSAGGGMMLFRSVLPDTVGAAAVGRRFADLASHRTTDGLDLVIRRLRPATDAEIAHVEGCTPMRTPGAPDTPHRMMISTFRNDKTAVRVPFTV